MLFDEILNCHEINRAISHRLRRDVYPSALEKDNVRPMKMSGRKPHGSVLVDPSGVGSDQSLRHWVARGQAFVSTLPTKSNTT